MDHNTRQRDAYEARQRARASEAESAFESSLIKARELVIRWTQFGLKLDNEPGTDHLQRLDKGVATDLDALRIDLHATQIRVGDTDSQKAVLLAKENFLAELALCLDDLGNLMQRK